MGMTLAEKILAAHSGKQSVSPGDLINVKVDLVMANDITAPIAIEQYRKLGVRDVFDKQRVVFVPSHFAPARDIATAASVLPMPQANAPSAPHVGVCESAPT